MNIDGNEKELTLPAFDKYSHKKIKGQANLQYFAIRILSAKSGSPAAAVAWGGMADLPFDGSLPRFGIRIRHSPLTLPLFLSFCIARNTALDPLGRGRVEMQCYFNPNTRCIRSTGRC